MVNRVKQTWSSLPTYVKVIVIFGVLSMAFAATQEAKESPQASASAPVVENTPKAPETPDEVVKRLAQKRWGKRFIDATVVDGVAVVKYEEYSVRRDYVERELRSWFAQAVEAEWTSMTIIAYHELRDQYGKVELGVIYEATVSRVEADKVVSWQMASPSVWTTTYVHRDVR